MTPLWTLSSDLIFHIYFQKGRLHYKADVLQVQGFTFETYSGIRTTLKKPWALVPRLNFHSIFKAEPGST